MLYTRQLHVDYSSPGFSLRSKTKLSFVNSSALLCKLHDADCNK